MTFRCNPDRRAVNSGLRLRLYCRVPLFAGGGTVSPIRPVGAARVVDCAPLEELVPLPVVEPGVPYIGPVPLRSVPGAFGSGRAVPDETPSVPLWICASAGAPESSSTARIAVCSSFIGSLHVGLWNPTAEPKLRSEPPASDSNAKRREHALHPRPERKKTPRRPKPAGRQSREENAQGGRQWREATAITDRSVTLIG